MGRLQIDPISRGLRLAIAIDFIKFIITNRPDFKGIETKKAVTPFLLIHNYK